MSSEVKVGLLFFCVLALAAATIIFLGDYGTRFSSYHVTVHFSDVKTLQRGGDVRLAGVRVGKVTAVAIRPTLEFPDKPVKVDLAINRRVALFTEDQFFIEQTSLVGDAFVSVRRRAMTRPPGEVGQLADGAAIAGVGPAGFSAVPEETERLLVQATKLINDARRLYLRDYNAQQVKQILENLAVATKRADDVAAGALDLVRTLQRTGASLEPRLDSVINPLVESANNVRDATDSVVKLAKGSPLPGQITLAAANVRQATEDLRGMVADVRRLVTGEETTQSVQSVVSNVVVASANIRQMTAEVRQLVADEQTRQSIRQTVANLEQASESIRKMSESVETLVSDPELARDVKATVRNARDASAGGVEVVGRANSTLSSASALLDRAGSAINSIVPSGFVPEVGLEAVSGDGLRADATARLRFGADSDRFWALGVRGIGDDNGLNLQYGLPLGERGLARLGLIGGKAGVGLGYSLGESLALEAELWDTKRQYLDTRALVRLDGDWWLSAGVADVFGEANPSIGVRRSAGPAGAGAKASRTKP